MGLIKCIVKVLNENKDSVVWEHLCYLPKDLYLEFLKTFQIERSQLAEFITVWAKRDFSIDIPMTTVKDIALLRALIVDKYKSVYPHIVRDSSTDRQGWVRVWMAQNMKRELERRGK